jgi:hypothetical protein
LIVHLPPLNWQRVPSCEDNSVLVMTHCISAGELKPLARTLYMSSNRCSQPSTLLQAFDDGTPIFKVVGGRALFR